MSLIELKKVLKENEIIFGSGKTLKNLKTGKLTKIFLTNNCPKKVREEIDYYSKLSKVDIVELKQSNDEIAAICKKPFPITVLSY